MKMNETAKKIPVTAAIMVKNSEKYLAEVLQRLSGFDEVLLLDNGSTDRTLEIAARFDNVSIHKHEFIGFGPMKNLAAKLARHDWIFSIDSDEIVTPELMQSIRQADLSQINRMYTLSRLNHYRGRAIKGCGWYPDIICRLYNRKHTRFNDRQVHESLEQPEGTQITALKGELLHYSFDSADGLIQKMQQYTSLYADQFRFTKRTSAGSAALHGLSSFIKNYFIKQGFKYGSDGFTISFSNAAGSFYKYIKLNERNQALRVSLLITTYNRPDALQKVLYSTLQQSVKPVEILIADDGSREDTAEVIQIFASHCPIPVKHLWQEDDGFRAAQARNRAIAAANGEYMVIIDGDMVLHPEFIRDHIQAAQKNTLIQGSRVMLTQEKTAELLSRSDQTEPISLFDKGIEKRLSALRCSHLSKFIWRKKSQSHKSIKSCNMGFFREDALAVNGFNNEFVGWGREDSEFVARLYHHGLKRRNLKFSGIAYHLWHHEAERDALPHNDALLNKTLENKLTRCENGVNQFLMVDTEN
ncbi:glycosyltransferase family 2 protein [Neisseria wadsworthii]|uniref:glycosyltransferase family 2 protein n=1 Tax=Neisseria wadsworthii TaxID=607711 RepID=UPI003CC819EF